MSVLVEFQLRHESGWARNGAGRQYSHKFGYGLMDAGQMVDLVTHFLPILSNGVNLDFK